MRLGMLPWSLLFTFSALADAFSLPFGSESELCVAACRRVLLNKVKFELPQTADGAAEATCHALVVESLFACATQYCTHREIVAGFPSVNSSCIEDDGNPLPAFENVAPASANITTVSWPAVKKQNHTTAVVPDRHFYHLAYETEYSINRAQLFNWGLSWALYGFWALVLGGAAVARLLPSVARRVSSVDGRSGPRKTNTIRAWIQRHLIVPYVYTSSETTGPTRAEALLLLMYAMLVFAFCFPGIHLFKEALMSWTEVQTERYIANRCGFLALANFPLVWLFGSRNNPFLWLTGWPYATFSQLHRWISRLVVLLLFVHGIGYTIGDSVQGTYRDRWAEEFYYTGGIALICLFLIIAIAHPYIRTHAYELFLASHICLAIAVLVCVKLHLKGDQQANYYGFLWPLVAIWCFDRAMRIARTLRGSLRSDGLGSEATRIDGTDIIRLDVSHFFPHTSPPPGSTFYIYEPGRFRGWESHPFSICSWPSQASDPHDRDPTPATPKQMTSTTVEGPGSIERADSPGPPATAMRHSCLIRARKGYTRGLLNSLLPPTASRRVRVLLEGPYVEPQPLHRHSDILLIAGGVGIAAAASRAHALWARQRTVRLVWSARSAALVHDVSARELHALRHARGVAVDIYLSRGPHDEKEHRLFPTHPRRPDVAAVIAEARAAAAHSLAVFCCGPAALSNACRHAVCDQLAREGKPMALYQETFGW